VRFDEYVPYHSRRYETCALGVLEANVVNV
jgi:hypothetical protein